VKSYLRNIKHSHHLLILQPAVAQARQDSRRNNSFPSRYMLVTAPPVVVPLVMLISILLNAGGLTGLMSQRADNDCVAVMQCLLNLKRCCHAMSLEFEALLSCNVS
jgi:hypothetical protein